jgi:hypothetical protein
MKTANKLTKIPSLKVVDNETAAKKLRELLDDANDAFRRIVKCGMYIEWIAANLPQGQFLPWLKFHCPDVGYTTIARWRSLAKNICDWAGLKFTQWVNLPQGETFLALPTTELPKQMQEARAKIETLLDHAKTPKQLFLDIGFKQGELDSHGYPKGKRGRLPVCKGTSKAQRDQQTFANDLERLEALKSFMEMATIQMQENTNDNGFPRVDEVEGGAEIQAAFFKACSEVHLYAVNLKKGRG